MHRIPSPVSGGAALFAALAVLLPLRAAAQDPPSPGEFIEVEVASVGLDLSTGAPLALLHSGWEHLLPVWIGEAEFAAILRGLRREVPPRPLTHDLLSSVISSLGGRLVEVRVHSVQDGAYVASLHIELQGGGWREVDSRPSDALALAVRTGARIRVAAALLQGVPEVDFVAAAGERPVVRYRGLTVREGRGVADVEVVHVTPAAATGGIRAGDRVVEVEGERVEGVLGLLDRLRQRPDGTAVPLVVEREGERIPVRLPPRRDSGRVGSLQ